MLRTQKERISGVSVLPQPCLLCGGRKGTPVHMHVRCSQSRLLWPHYNQAGKEAAQHLPPGDKALWVALCSSASAEWTIICCYGLVFDAAEPQHRMTTRYDPRGGYLFGRGPPSHARAGDFVWELHNHRLAQVLRRPHSAAARVHRCLRATKGDYSPPPPRPSTDFVDFLCLVNGTLQCPAREDPQA